MKQDQPLRLKCVFRLKRREEFRGIRWYKNGSPIFSYAINPRDESNPHSDPFKFAYPSDGMEVDASFSRFFFLA